MFFLEFSIQHFCLLNHLNVEASNIIENPKEEEQFYMFCNENMSTSFFIDTDLDIVKAECFGSMNP